MERIVENRRRLTLAAVAVLAVVVCAFGIQGVARAVDVSYAVNDAGQTYGSALDATGAEQPIQPDLVLVSASNGADGYVYSSDVEAALAVNDEWDESDIAADVARKAHLLVAACEETYGVALFDEEDACAYLLDCDSSVTGDAAIARLTETMAQQAALQLDLAANSNSLSSMSEIAADAKSCEPALAELLQQVREETAIWLPVYAEDGTTMVGEFPVTTM